MTAHILHGDATALPLRPQSVDAIVCDPPYGLEFMGKDWDRFAGQTADRDFKGFVLSQQRTRNVKCPECQRWAYDKPGRLCECGGIRRAQGNAFQQFSEQWATEAFRVLKPGGYLLAFGGSRTWHRLACAIEDAGFELRDSIAWMYGSGFPKSLDVSKAIDKARDDRPDILRVTSWLKSQAKTRGFTRAEVDEFMETSDMAGWWMTDLLHRCQCPTWDQWDQLKRFMGLPGDMDAEVWRLNGRKGTPGEAWAEADVLRVEERFNEPSGIVNAGQGEREQIERQIKAANSAAARQWQGWGTALKPAFEPIIVARKPLIGTVAQNVTMHGTGALNIDGCRVEGVPPSVPRGQFAGSNNNWEMAGRNGKMSEPHALGRWPSNVVLSHGMTAWYSVRRDLPADIANGLSYSYGSIEAVRVVPGGDFWAALRGRKAPVLLEGLCEPCAQGRSGEGPGDGDLSTLRRELRDVSGVGAQRPEEVLLEGMSGESEPRSESSRSAAHGRGAQSDGREPTDPRTVLPMEGRALPGEGLLARHGGDAAGGDAADRSADDAAGVHLGAPGASGGADRSSTPPGRDRASHQRGEARQPAGESAGDEARRPLAGAPGNRAPVCAATERGGTIACGERRLAVPAGLISAESLPLFDFLGAHGDCGEVCEPGCPVAMLDQQSGTSRSVQGAKRGGGRTAQSDYRMRDQERDDGYGDSGGASRFFPTFRYQAKAPSRERPVGPDGTKHPTCKPLDLMRWLVRLVTPPGGIVLDPFAGSGTTLEAAQLEGFTAIGVEKHAPYLPLIVQRLERSRIAPTVETDWTLDLFGDAA